MVSTIRTEISIVKIDDAKAELPPDKEDRLDEKTIRLWIKDFFGELSRNMNMEGEWRAEDEKLLSSLPDLLTDVNSALVWTALQRLSVLLPLLAEEDREAKLIKNALIQLMRRFPEWRTYAAPYSEKNREGELLRRKMLDVLDGLLRGQDAPEDELPTQMQQDIDRLLQELTHHQESFNKGPPEGRRGDKLIRAMLTLVSTYRRLSSLQFPERQQVGEKARTLINGLLSYWLTSKDLISLTLPEEEFADVNAFMQWASKNGRLDFQNIDTKHFASALQEDTFTLILSQWINLIAKESDGDSSFLSLFYAVQEGATHLVDTLPRQGMTARMLHCAGELLLSLPQALGPDPVCSGDRKLLELWGKFDWGNLPKSSKIQPFLFRQEFAFRLKGFRFSEDEQVKTLLEEALCGLELFLKGCPSNDTSPIESKVLLVRLKILGALGEIAQAKEEWDTVRFYCDQTEQFKRLHLQELQGQGSHASLFQRLNKLSLAFWAAREPGKATPAKVGIVCEWVWDNSPPEERAEIRGMCERILEKTGNFRVAALLAKIEQKAFLKEGKLFDLLRAFTFFTQAVRGQVEGVPTTSFKALVREWALFFLNNRNRMEGIVSSTIFMTFTHEMIEQAKEIKEPQIELLVGALLSVTEEEERLAEAAEFFLLSDKAFQSCYETEHSAEDSWLDEVGICFYSAAGRLYQIGGKSSTLKTLACLEVAEIIWFSGRFEVHEAFLLINAQKGKLKLKGTKEEFVRLAKLYRQNGPFVLCASQEDAEKEADAWDSLAKARANAALGDKPWRIPDQSGRNDFFIEKGRYQISLDKGITSEGRVTVWDQTESKSKEVSLQKLFSFVGQGRYQIIGEEKPNEQGDLHVWDQRSDCLLWISEKEFLREISIVLATIDKAMDFA